MRYTPPAVSLFRLVPGDLGRRLPDLRHQLDYAELRDDAERVLATLVPVEREAVAADGRWFLARLSRGNFEIARAPVDLREAVRRAVEVCESDVQAKGQRLEIALDAPERRLEGGDFARLQQVFWNLLKDAAKFTPEGGTIRLTSRPEEPGRIAVAVTDSGIGIETDALTRIFAPSEQANASITQRFGGPGLGLAIARATVEAHGAASAPPAPIGVKARRSPSMSR